MKIWDEAYIIGGGPSLKLAAGLPIDEKDNDIIFRAVSDYLKPLIGDKRCIGVNNAYKLGDWIDICWFGDDRWFREHVKSLNQFKGIIATCAPGCRNSKNLWFTKRGPRRGISTKEDVVAWNLNSGFSAINFAYLLGAKRIVLVGFDMKKEEAEYNFHTEHTWQVKTNYSRYLAVVNDLKKDANRLGITIINANPDSALEVFPKAVLADVCN